MGFDPASITAAGVGAVLGGVGQLAKDIREAWTGELPAEKKVELELRLNELEAQAMNAQATINLEEARSDKWFVSGWRPFIGWSCGMAFVYAAIVEPVSRFVAKVGFGYNGEFPVIDTMLTMQVLIGMLGLGVFRSYDKKQAPAPKGKE